MFAATAIAAAARAAALTGEGHRLDISLEDTLIAMLAHIGARQLASDVPEPTVHNGHATIAPYGLFATGEGQINICVGNHDQFLRMCQALGLAELPADPRFATNADRVGHKAELNAAIEARLARLTADEALAALEAAGVPSGAVRTLDVALADPVVRARGMVAALERADFGTVEVPNSPWVIDSCKPPVYLPPPALGEHGDEVRREWSRDRPA
jgi:crotonobetainyl-CoA:carnitine CoA-transferase CaiB-like acyl-CoA transferase